MIPLQIGPTSGVLGTFERVLGSVAEAIDRATVAFERRLSGALAMGSRWCAVVAGWAVVVGVEEGESEFVHRVPKRQEAPRKRDSRASKAATNTAAYAFHVFHVSRPWHSHFTAMHGIGLG